MFILLCLSDIICISAYSNLHNFALKTRRAKGFVIVHLSQKKIGVRKLVKCPNFLQKSQTFDGAFLSELSNLFLTKGLGRMTNP